MEFKFSQVLKREDCMASTVCNYDVRYIVFCANKAHEKSNTHTHTNYVTKFYVDETKKEKKHVFQNYTNDYAAGRISRIKLLLHTDYTVDKNYQIKFRVRERQ